MERGYCLSEIAAAIGGGSHIALGDDRITDLSIDTRRTIAPAGTLFIALRGPHHDGHDHVGAAIGKGVRNVLVEEDAEFNHEELNTLTVPDTLVALQRLAAWHRAHFSYPVIGITGSNGKTVVKEWLFQLLREEEHIVRSPGSWNSQVGVPLSVWEMGAEHTLGLFEAGISLPGEMERLAPIIAPTLGIFTNLGPAHGEHFSEGDAQKAQEKALLFRDAEAVVFCRDHTVVRDALDAVVPKSVLRCDWSRTHPAFVQLKAEKASARGTVLELVHGDSAFTCGLPFTDAASIENAMQAITALLRMGHTPEWIAGHVQRLEPVAMRLQSVEGVDNTTLINDAYSNDLASLTIALEQLVRSSAGRPRVAVVSDILESGDDPKARYARMGELLRRAGVERIIGIGPEIAKHLAASPGAQFFPDVDAALNGLHKPPLAGAVVLLKGARSFGLERLVDAWQQRTHGTVLEIDLDAVRHNLNHYRVQCGPDVRVMAMVKASGYGSGAVELSRLFAHEQVSHLGVAYVDEGVELRQNGIRTPVLVMNPEPVALQVLHRFDLGTVVYDATTLDAVIAFARQVHDAPAVHIKLDTGMHRLGFLPDEVPQLCERLRGAPLRVASIFSHLAASEDPAQDAFTRMQIASFEEGARRITEVLGYRPLWHIANTAGAARFPEARFDLVRLGIGLHGIGADATDTAKLMPTATLRTVIAQVKDIPQGDTVGYGRTFRAEHPTRIAVLPIGYADGLSRRLSNGVGRVWIHGRPAPFAGIICMDMCMVDVTGIPCSVGEAAVVFSQEHPLQDFARDLGTIPYEALTSISARVKRIYLHG